MTHQPAHSKISQQCINTTSASRGPRRDLPSLEHYRLLVAPLGEGHQACHQSSDASIPDLITFTTKTGVKVLTQDK